MKLNKGVLLLCLVLSLCCSCSRGNDGSKAETQTNMPADAQDSETDGLVTFEEARNQLDQTMEDAYNGKYDKLEFIKSQPQMPDIDEIGNIIQIWPEVRDRSMTAEECIKEQYEWLCEMAGRKLDKKKIIDLKTEKSLEEAEKMLEKGTYPEEGKLNGQYKPSLDYNESDGSFALNSSKCYIWGEWKKVKKIQPDSDKITQVDKIYYANATDGSLEDSYELADGPCTVKEAVEWAEEYENEKRPYKPGEGFRVRAANVRVFKLTDKIYAYSICMRREYNGVLFEGIFEGTSKEIVTSSEDMGTFIMIDRETPDMIINMGANEIIKPDGETYKKIIPLSRALEILNSRIGENTHCRVRSMEMIYRMGIKKFVEKEGGYEYQSKGEPVWKIEIANGNDNRVTVFYIGVTDVEGKNMKKSTMN